jgi:hypothetical protein
MIYFKVLSHIALKSALLFNIIRVLMIKIIFQCSFLSPCPPTLGISSIFLVWLQHKHWQNAVVFIIHYEIIPVADFP